MRNVYRTAHPCAIKLERQALPPAVSHPPERVRPTAAGYVYPVPPVTLERPPRSRVGRDEGSGSSHEVLGRPDRTILAAALTGLLSCCVLVLIAGRAARVPGAVPPSSWLGLTDAVDRPALSAVVGGVEISAVLLLVLAWGWLLRSARRLRARVVVIVGLLWAAPFALGPPVLSLDAYSYLAQGRLAALGIDPYRNPPAALLGGAWLQGVDPFWRHAQSPYGPLAVLLERAVAVTGDPAVALVLLHALALGCLGVVALVVRQLAPRSQRSTVLLLTVGNPVVLLQLLGAAHWEALLVALLAMALLAWQRERPELAIALASTAAAVKLPAGFALAVLLLLHVLGGTPGRLWRTATGFAAAAVPWLLLSLMVPNAFGFRDALTTPLSGRTLYAPTTLLAEGLAKACGLAGVAVPFDTLLGMCRVSGVLLATGVCCALLATASRRPAGTTIGLGLLVVALLGPVLYPWYCTWGLIPLALTSRGHHRLVALLSGAMTFTALPGCQALGERLLALDPAVLPPTTLVIAVTVVLALTTRSGAGRRPVAGTGSARQLVLAVAPPQMQVNAFSPQGSTPEYDAAAHRAS